MPTTLTDAMRDLLDGRRYAILATQNEDGSIHLTPVWYLFADGRFYADSLSTDRKARNVAARPGATIIVDVRQPGGESWVSAAGTAQLVQGDESQEINTRIVRRYLTDAAMNDARIGPAFTGAADATICADAGGLAHVALAGYGRPVLRGDAGAHTGSVVSPGRGMILDSHRTEPA